MTGFEGLVPSSAAVSQRMSRHPRRDSQPELAVRRLLHKAGVRYRIQVRVPGMRRRTIDIAFPRWKLAVFVDGCFWHGCPTHRSYPVANTDFWRKKIDGNVSRDAETTRHLAATGWVVVRVWEHEAAAAAAAQVLLMLELRKAEVPPARRRTGVGVTS